MPSLARQINEKHNTTFVFLEGRAKQFVVDHSLEGPTYQHALRKEARGRNLVKDFCAVRWLSVSKWNVASPFFCWRNGGRPLSDQHYV